MQLDQNKVVIAMSGGVDSSVAALLLKQAGYEVVGITLKLWDPPKDEVYRHTTCCSVEDITGARRVADQIGIPFYVINAKENFKTEVINPFVSEYLKGRTPNPCALCNQKVKFSFLHQKAFELGAYFVATGHFARRHWAEEKKIWQLLKGKDSRKDQSYFLFSLNQEQLEHTLFPVGELTKEEVRALAAEHGLKTRNKPESQEICFVSSSHSEFIQKYAPQDLPPTGQVLDEAGKVIGQHSGIHQFTVGQRRGTQVAQGERIYVKSINPQTHVVTMAASESLFQHSLTATGVRWVHAIEDGAEVNARIRYRHEGASATLRFESESQVSLYFKEPQRAIAPGQAVVFYQGDQVLGGGWIERAGQ